MSLSVDCGKAFSEKIAMQPIDLATWLRDHFQTRWAGDLRGNRIAVEGVGPIVVTVEPEMFGVALDTLIENAFKYGIDGTPVLVSISRRASNILITVVNHGTNIPEAERGRVFEQPGRGLTRVAEIIRSFGGKISALPQRGGARIAIVLPVTDEEANPNGI